MLILHTLIEMNSDRKTKNTIIFEILNKVNLSHVRHEFLGVM